MPSAIAQVQRELKDQGLVVLAVSIKEPAATVGGWTKRVALSFPVVLDEDGAMMASWRVSSTPTVYLIDRRGRVVARAVGTKPWSSPAGRAVFSALLGS